MRSGRGSDDSNLSLQTERRCANQANVSQRFRNSPSCGERFTDLVRRKLSDGLRNQPLPQIAIRRKVASPLASNLVVARKIHCIANDRRRRISHRRGTGQHRDRKVESEGIKMIDPVPMIDHWLAPAGLAAGPAPTAAQIRDLELAFKVAAQLGSYDIGQTVAVRDGMVAAVEALEGTDAALRRAAALVGAGLVVAKAAKPGQDLRFDRPAIGSATIDLLGEIGAAMIGVEAGVALILERDRTLELAHSKNIIVYGHGEQAR